MEQLDDGSIPVARAIPVTKDAPDGAAPEAGTPAATDAPAQVAAAPVEEPEVRKAESVAPLDSPLDRPVLQLPPPSPIDFQ